MPIRKASGTGPDRQSKLRTRPHFATTHVAVPDKKGHACRLDLPRLAAQEAPLKGKVHGRDLEFPLALQCRGLHVDARMLGLSTPPGGPVNKSKKQKRIYTTIVSGGGLGADIAHTQ